MVERLRGTTDGRHEYNSACVRSDLEENIVIDMEWRETGKQRRPNYSLLREADESRTHEDSDRL